MPGTTSDWMQGTITSAIELLEDEGWTQGTATGPDGEHCLVAALAIGGSYHDTEWDELLSTLATEVGLSDIDGAGLVQWNDAAGRTQEQILDVLYRTLGQRRNA